MSTIRRWLQTLDSDGGSATVEFAILLPPILITIFWSIFLMDLVQVRLKGQEIVRHMTWESTVYREPAAVLEEARKRFANLKSVDLEPAGTDVFFALGEIVIEPTYVDTLEVKMAGQIPEGSLPIDLNGILGGVSSGANAVTGWMKLPKQGKARSEVQIRVKNGIIPATRMLHNELRGDDAGLQDEWENGFVLRDHHVMVFDTWKAWPNKNRLVGRRDGHTANPMQTYQIAEKLVADQVGEIAFGQFIPVIGEIVDFVQMVDEFFSWFKLPKVLNDDAFTEKTGPVTLRPVETVNVASWSPSYGKNDATRWGHRKANGKFNADNAEITGIDRSHYSLPYKPTGGHWWNKDGGYNNGKNGVKPFRDSMYDNDYVKTYACRGHYYEGMVVEDGKQGDYQNYDGCGDGVDTIQKNLGDLFEDFGGFSLPSF